MLSLISTDRYKHKIISLIYLLIYQETESTANLDVGRTLYNIQNTSILHIEWITDKHLNSHAIIVFTITVYQCLHKNFDKRLRKIALFGTNDTRQFTAIHVRRAR